MKNLFTALILLLLFSCKESGVQLGKPNTFVRYFNGGTPDVAQSIIHTSDGGYLILANTQTTLTSTYYRIKLIKVDRFGNQTAIGLFPKPGKSQPNYRGFGLTAISGGSGDSGYLIVGDEIYDSLNNGRVHGLLMIQVKIAADSIYTTQKVTLKPGTIGDQVRGVAVSQSKVTGNFIVLGENLSSPATDMFYAEVSATTLAKSWTKSFGDGTTNLVNKLFLNGDSLYWAGTVFPASPPSKMRFVKSRFNDKPVAPNFYPFGGSANFTCTDIGSFGYGYGLVGSYSSTSGAYSHIAFFRLNQSGIATDSAKYLLHDKFSQSDQFEAGNSVAASNGGFIILGTTAGDATATADTNYLLIRTDANGHELWRKPYGGSFRDIGCKVLGADDGGYVVLGTTTLANVQSIFLMKTDSGGNIE